jgi:hypothetical protein
MLDDPEGETEYLGIAVRSELDWGVWVAVLPDVDIATGAMQASTSINKVKRYIEGEVARWPGHRDVEGEWVRRDKDCWEYWEKVTT